MTDLWNQPIVAEMVMFLVNVLVQSTLLAALALLAASFLRRWAAIRHCVLFSALFGLLVVPILTVALAKTGIEIASLPLLARSADNAPAAEAPDRSNMPTAPVGEMKPEVAGTGDVGDAAIIETVIPKLNRQAGVRDLRAGGDSASDRGSQISFVAAALLTIWLLGMIVGLWGIARSDWRLRRIIRRTRPLGSIDQRQILGQVCRILSIKSTPPIVCSPDVEGPTVAGMVRPRIILPARIVADLSTEELRDILLHEMAHVLRRDQWVVLLQQAVGALYWLNPLVHVLNRQLARAREEICDNYVLSSVEPVDYGETLLHLGLLLPRPQLPARSVGMFNTDWKLEDRIAGLLDERRTAMIRLHPILTVAIGVSACLLSLALAGSRVGLAQGGSPNSAAANTSTDQKPATAGLEYVPPSAMAMVSLRPADLLSHPGLQGLAGIFAQEESFQREFGLPPTEISQLTIIPFVGAQQKAPDAVGFVIHARRPFDADQVLALVAPDAEKKESKGAVYYHHQPTRGRGRFVYVADNRTLIVSDQETSFWPLVRAGKAGAGSAGWTKSWASIKDGHVAIVGNLPQIKTFMEKATEGAPEEAIQGFAPLWNRGAGAAASLVLDKQLKVSGRFHCKAPADAPHVERAVQATLALVKVQLQRQKQLAARSPRVSEAELAINDLADKLLDAIKVERQGQIVQVRTEFDAQATAQALAQSVAAVKAARGAARRQISANNLKQFGLAMHNYHASNGHFPPPVVVGPDGKTVHSWRVAVLPYVGEQTLYDEYRKDEPWDSPHNKKVLAKMPAVYRHPSEKENSTNTSYFVLTGKETAFVGKKGTQIIDMRDGTSNTILTVEIKGTMVPWTKPVDIPYDATKKLPKLGGYDPKGFYAGFGDGSVRFISHKIDEKVLRGLITIDGGEIVSDIP